MVVCLLVTVALILLAYRSVTDVETQGPEVRTVATVVEKCATPEVSSDALVQSAAEVSQSEVEPSVDVQGMVVETDDATSAAGEPERAFVMPEGAAFEEGAALVSVDPKTSVEAVKQLLSETSGVVAREVSAEEVASGTIKVELAEGTGVEEAVNELLQSPVVCGAQPEYEYYLQLGTAEDLRAELDRAATEPEPPAVEILSETGEAGVDEAADNEAESESAVDVVEPSDNGEEPDLMEEEAPAEDETPAAEETTEEVIPGEEETPEEVIPVEEEVPAVEETPTAEGDGASGAEELLAAVSVNDPLVQPSTGNDWALKSLRAYEAWDVVKTNRSVTVAVLDAGFQADHEDLKANVVKSYNSVSGAGDVTPPGGRNYTHGTHVAGIVSGVANNGKGVAGISYNAGLMLVKIADDNGVIKTSYVKKAYDQIMAEKQSLNVRVVNLSMGALAKNATDTVLLQSIRTAFDSGIVTVAAAGNSDLGTVPYAEYPGDDPYVVSVINLTQDSSGAVSRYHTSNYNLPNTTAKNVSAPGTGIMSTVSGGTYSTLSGTSMASPQVAGIIALEFAINPKISANQAVSYLYSTATDLGTKGFDEVYGWGEANAYAAVKAAQAGKAISGYTEDQWAQEQLDQTKAAAVQAKIDALPATATITRAHRSAITSARAAYNALTDAQKRYVTNYARLTQAEAALAKAVPTVTRLYGQNAYDTAKAIVSAGSLFKTGGTVIVATGGGYWDALAASGLAGRLGAPLLITPKDSLASQTKDLLVSLKPAQVLVMGGTLAVSDAVLAQIKSVTGVTPARVYGQTAVDTSVAIYNKGTGWPKTAIVATVNGYWDALSAAPYAYAKGMPIFLVNSTLPQAVASSLKNGGFTDVVIVGGALAVSDAVANSIGGLGINVHRVWGQNAIDTSMAIANRAIKEGMSANNMGVATSGGYWDALTGAAFCGRQNAVLVLVQDQRSVTLTKFAADHKLEVAQAYIFGGKLAVSQASEATLKAALQ